MDVSLLGSGLWAMGHAVAISLHLDRPWVAPPAGVHGAPANPLSGLYRTADDRYLSLVMLQPGKFWADVCRHIDRPDLADDPRFTPAEHLAANAAEAAKILQEVFAPPSAGRVGRALRHPGRAVGPGAGHPAGRLATRRSGPTSTSRPGRRPRTGLQPGAVRRDRPGPEPGARFAAQTEEILLELGLDWDRIAALK